MKVSRIGHYPVKVIITALKVVPITGIQTVKIKL